MKNEENIHDGDLIAESGVKYNFTKITGYLYASGADTKTAFPKLTSVGGSLDASGADTKTAFPKLTSVGGSLDARGADTKTAFPKLTSVGGFLYARGADTKTAFPKLTSVGDSLYASGADTKTAFPKLTSVGGFLYASGDYSKVKTHDSTASEKCRKMLLASFMAAGFSFADGILAKIVSTRGQVQKVIVCGETKESYLVSDGDSFSHGKTLREARDGLLYKIGDRDKSEFENWTLKKMITKRDAIRAYRIITGACEAGVRSWLKQQDNVHAKMSVQHVINITKGAYGSEAFKSFFAK